MKRHHTGRRILQGTMAAVLALTMAGCQEKKETTGALNPEDPTTVTVWNYYNGDQQVAFEQLVEEFNRTVGTEQGIVVVTVSQGDVNTLADALLESVQGKAGAQERPTLASVCAETAYILDRENALEPLGSYFTEDELSAYVPGFLEEGRFNAENELLLFPILKSTELFTANETDWEPFAKDTGITLDGLSTMEDLTAAAKRYYEWTDAQTPEIPEDGKALYGRDSVANYIYLGTYQLGHEMFCVKNGEMTLDLDRDTFQTLWDNYYIPYINGYFGAYSKYRSEDCKTGKILALTSSSASVSYLPTSVTLEDDQSHDITIFERTGLPFEQAVNDAVVQQGANYCLLRSTPAQQEGAVAFLKWFSDPTRNLTFATSSGYSPVTLAANEEGAIKKAFVAATDNAKEQNMLKALLLSAESFRNQIPYATKPFHGSKDVRSVLGDALQNKAEEDRAAVLDAIAQGSTREDAVRPFTTDDYFEAWFEPLCTQMEQLTAQ